MAKRFFRYECNNMTLAWVPVIYNGEVPKARSEDGPELFGKLVELDDDNITLDDCIKKYPKPAQLGTDH